MNKLRILFYGTPDFAACGLAHLLAVPEFEVCAVVTQPDKPAGRGGALQTSPVKKLAVTHAIAVLQPHSVRKEEGPFTEALKAFAPIDVGVVIAFGQILPLSVLQIPRAGSINIHASLLPRWRGAAPMQRALMSGDKETGICLMRMEAGLDTGPVYVRSPTTIEAGETFGSLHNRLAEEGGRLLVKHLAQIAGGELPAIPQSADGVTHAAKINSPETQINWTKGASEIANLVCALSPVPSAFTMLGGKRLKVLLASTAPHNIVSATEPGEIIRIDPQSLEVSCGTGSIHLHEVQLEGKKKMKVADFLRGTNIAAHTRLGG